MEENKLITLLSKHWSKFLLGILAVATVAAWSERLLHSNQNENKHDFFIAQQIFERFHKGEYLPAESIEAAQNILDRHPELHPKYDLVLALTFFSQQKPAEGTRYARSLINHAEQHLPPLYKDYAHTTLLISDGHYRDAFSAAITLEEKLASQTGYDTLDAMNTLRILFLAHELGEAAQQQTSWIKLSQHPAYASIASVFQAGNVSLTDYFHLSS